MHDRAYKFILVQPGAPVKAQYARSCIYPSVKPVQASGCARECTFVHAGPDSGCTNRARWVAELLVPSGMSRCAPRHWRGPQPPFVPLVEQVAFAAGSSWAFFSAHVDTGGGEFVSVLRRKIPD
jgi:hypothetical protein